MPRRVQKSVQDCLNRLKFPSPHTQVTSKSTTAWILSGCMRSKTLSFGFNQNQNDVRNQNKDSATLKDIDKFLMENFSSLYRKNNEEEDEEKKASGSERGENPSAFLYELPKFISPPPKIHASQRHFVHSGSSSSLVEEAQASGSSSTFDVEDQGSTSINLNETLRSSAEVKGVPLPDEAIAILTFSPDPYDDFRQSMQEMISARVQQDQHVDWDFMEELLFCYLNLNEKKSNKYILGAFVDLVIGLRQKNENSPVTTFRKSPQHSNEEAEEGYCNVTKDLALRAKGRS